MYRNLIKFPIVHPSSRHFPALRQLPALRHFPALHCTTHMESSQAAVWHRRLAVGDSPTDVWGVDPPSTTDALLQILVIPGNPGIGSYYLPFMTALQQHLDVPATIRTLSHAGQDVHNTGDCSYSLRDQIDHKVAFLRAHMQLGPDAPPLIIAGHSIGAYMAVHAVRMLGADSSNIQCVAALFPFFAVDSTSYTQRRLQWLVQRPGLAGTVVSAVAWLPLPLRRALVGAYGGAI